MRFVTPWMLVFLLAIPVLIALARRRRTPRGVVMVRSMVLALLIVCLAGPQVTVQGRGLTVMFAIDHSASVPVDARDAAAEFARAALRSRSTGDRAGAVVFGAEAMVDEAPSVDPRLAFSAEPAGDATDLAQAIRTALLAMPIAGGRRIVLATDGNGNTGDLAGALALARSQEVEISVLPLQPSVSADVLIEEVQAPDEVRIGAQFPVRVVLRATARARVTLRVSENATPIDQRTLALAPGRSIVTIHRAASSEGLLQYAAAITADPDGTTANNTAAALVVVRGKPVVWYVGAGDGPLRRILAAQPWRVQTVVPEALPPTVAQYRGVSALVFDDVSATRLSVGQMAAVRDFVGRLGGGLAVVGGAHSFGIGGYANTPLEEALPVSMDVRHRLAIPSMAVLLVIDTSGSMGPFGQGLAKVELAKETAQSVIDLLGERDVIGVVAFDQEARWLVLPTAARFRDQVLERVSRLIPGGGTNMHPALALAYDYLRRSPAKIRHVIVLSDGQTDPGDFEGLVTRMARDKITVSSVAVGKDADTAIMANIARWGEGRSYATQDLYTIPQIVTAEALLASRAYVVEERFVPEVNRTDVLAGLGTLPALRGYVATAPKPAGIIHLSSAHDDPILATWQYGVGRAAAFTSDAAPRWAAEWMSWSNLARFWSQLTAWVIRDDAQGLQLTLERARSDAAVIVDAFTPDGTPLDGLEVTARISGPQAQTLRLVQTAAGRYEGRVPAAVRGAYAVTVVARTQHRIFGTRTGGFVVPYSAELRDLEVNRQTLLQIIEATGGHIFEDPKMAFAPTGQGSAQTADAWPVLAAGAVGLFMAEIVLRRVPAIGYYLTAAGGAIMGRLRRQPGSAQVSEDQQYEQADRWKFVEPQSTAAAESMQAAARLYIVRLKGQGSTGTGEHANRRTREERHEEERS
ncbi:MAG TPA: VWA domain-containing protein [bacterium]